MEQIKDTTPFPGQWGFDLALGPNAATAATLSTVYTFSNQRNKLYVQRGAQCPFKFKTLIEPPPNSYVKVTPVLKGTHVLIEPVKRCSNHAEEEDEGKFTNFYMEVSYCVTEISVQYRVTRPKNVLIAKYAKH